VRRIRYLGKKYLGNKNKMEVHDLDREDVSENGCQINEVTQAGNAVIFHPDTLEEAHKRGYDNCVKCLRVTRR
jgi:hypothetical protein